MVLASTLFGSHRNDLPRSIETQCAKIAVAFDEALNHPIEASFLYADCPSQTLPWKQIVLSTIREYYRTMELWRVYYHVVKIQTQELERDLKTSLSRLLQAIVVFNASRRGYTITRLVESVDGLRENLIIPHRPVASISQNLLEDLIEELFELYGQLPA